MNGNFDLLHLTHTDAPAEFIVAARESAGKAEILGSGRGLTRETALASCLGEMAERAAASQIDALQIIEARATDLPGSSIAPNQFWQFSDVQLRDGPDPGELISPRAWSVVKEHVSNCTSWCLAKPNHAGPDVFVPIVNVVLGEGPTDSNGLAAGIDRSTAQVTALLELVERDAVAIWWYGRIRRPSVPLGTLHEPAHSDLRRWLERRQRRTWFLDLTNDLGVPVIAAISADQNGSNIAYGFAAHLSVRQASQSAVLEMLQSELSLILAEKRALQSGRPEGPAGRFLSWSRSASVTRMAHLLPDLDATTIPSTNSPAADLSDVVARKTGVPVVFVDLDLPDDTFKVVRALSPCLRSWRPRFRRGRLQSVPRTLGWAREAFDETSFDGNIILI